MLHRGWRQHMEDRTAALEGSMGELRSEVGAIGGKIDKLVEGMSTSGERAAERAQSVKTEIRDESDRKAKDRSDLFKNGLALMGGVSIIVGALVGPYLSQLNTTSRGQQDDTKAISAVREVLAQQGAEEGRLQASQDIQRDNGLRRDAELREHDQDLAFMKGAMAAKGWPTH